MSLRRALVLCHCDARWFRVIARSPEGDEAILPVMRIRAIASLALLAMVVGWRAVGLDLNLNLNLAVCLNLNLRSP